MRKITITILVLMLCSSCSTWLGTASDLSAKQNIVDVYDCSDKARAFQKREGGQIVVVRQSAGGLHMFNHLGNYLIDTTFNPPKVKKIKITMEKTALAYWGTVIPGFVSQHKTDIK